MTNYEVWIVFLLAAFIVLSAVGAWLGNLRVLGLGITAFGIYLLTQVVHSM